MSYLGYTFLISRSVTPDDEASPREAPPPYRMPPPAAVSATSPEGRSQYYQSSTA